MKNFKPLWEMPAARRKNEWAARGVGICPICEGGIDVGQMISPWLKQWAHSDCKSEVTQVTFPQGNQTA